MKIEKEPVNSHPTFSIEPVSSKNEPYKMLLLCKEWYKLAKQQYQLAHDQSYQIKKEQIQLIRNSYTTISDILSALIHTNHTIYIAVSTISKKIQAVALVSFSEEIPELCALATNPDNLGVFNNEMRVSGSCRALIAGIAQDILKSQSLHKNLSVLSNIFARSFYTKLGFKQNSSNPTDLLLDEPALKILVKTTSEGNEFQFHGSSQND